MHQPFDNFNRVGHGVSGIVSAVDPVRMAVKVRVQPEDVESTWLPVGTMAAGSLRICRVPEINENVTLMASRGDSEQLMVVAAEFDTSVVPPVSPLTGKVAQPGELLIVAGAEGPPTSPGTAGTPAQASVSWLHITGTQLGAGIGTTSMRLTTAGIIFTASDVLASNNLGSEIGYTGTLVDKTGKTYTFLNGLCMK